MKSIQAALILATALSACAAPPPPPAPSPARPKVAVLDGFYRGTTTRFQANSRACPRPGLVTLQVFDRRFQYRWTRDTYIDAEILPDGSIQGETFGISLTGRLTGNKMVGDVTNGDCGLHFTVTRRD